MRWGQVGSRSINEVAIREDHEMKPISRGPRYSSWHSVLLFYLAAYAFPFPFGFLPFGLHLYNRLSSECATVLEWYFHLATSWANPSGFAGRDVTSAMLGVLVTMLFAIMGAAIARRLNGILRLKLERILSGYISLYLGATLIAYGAFKILPAQFPVPDQARLSGTYAASSLTQLLWMFMGSSKLYAGFGGALEFLAGALLMLGYASAGSFLASIVLVNVAVIDLSYHVPAFLLSLHLLGTAVFLIRSEIRQIVEILLRSDSPTGTQMVRLTKVGPHPKPGALRIATLVAFAGIQFWLAYAQIHHL